MARCHTLRFTVRDVIYYSILVNYIPEEAKMAKRWNYGITETLDKVINVIKTVLKFVLVLFHLLTIRHIFPHAAGSVRGLSYTLLTAIEN